ncbi:MAG: gliding motility-associated protein GldE [Bacteroidales bacterium]|nr:gliding motility-associated protein GldE [Bacteroidales bacterium]MDY3067780.1 gliding motility-associated protein GldE [Porphyromonas sp.]
MDDPSYLSSLFDGVQVHPMSVSVAIAILAGVVCLGLSAFFSGSEVAFFSLQPRDIDELEEGKGKHDRHVLDALAQSDYLLGTILVMNNFVNISITMLTSYAVSRLFDFSAAPTLGFLVQVVGITFLILLFGEILPKVYFQNHALAAVRSVMMPMRLFMKLTSPIVHLLVKVGEKAVKPFASRENKVSETDLERAIELTTDSEEEQELLHGIVRFQRKTVNDVMTPRMDMVSVETSIGFSEIRQIIADNGYSRMPVYEHRIDNIKGVLYAKDLLPHLTEGDDFDWNSLVREPYFVPESKKINSLLQAFKEEKIHMAIVVDEFGGTSGLVTMEDLLEEIVGEIEDEYDTDEEVLYTEQPDGSYIFDAKIGIVDFLRTVRVSDFREIEEEMDEVDTLGGMLLEVKGDFPVVGEEIYVRGHRFVVLEMGRRRISKVRFFPDPKTIEEE